MSVTNQTKRINGKPCNNIPKLAHGFTRVLAGHPCSDMHDRKMRACIIFAMMILAAPAGAGGGNVAKNGK